MVPPFKSKPPAPKAQSHSKAFAHEKTHGNIKPKAKQPPPAAERAKRLYTALCAQIDGGHFANAVRTCDKLLRIDPHDADALQTKLFLLLQTEQYVPALALIDGLRSPSTLPSPSTPSAKSEFEFEKAYSYYRLHREDEAAGVMATIKARETSEESRGVLHLEAQLAYRQGAYDAAVELYNVLQDTAEPHSDEHADILTNLAAAQAHLDFLNTGFLHALGALPPAFASALEGVPPPASSVPSASHSVLPSGRSSHPQTETAGKEKEKKVRTKRLPPGVILGVTPPPDPERWLKKSERSTFAYGKKRRGGATQGAVEREGAAASGGGQSGKIGGGGGGGGKGKKRR
ncbi:hypothetical protein AcV5_003851 [Taiwanofungus camphoratus]|nr:hypothetical protein AcV5_003851 [Antrodia cinnamomea]KAI0919396.1 hypothetical protein AcV7_006146 [Antrodia cinnamomea]